tara:strand:+ start:21535 stop:22437 length:903 start_codon:yes stop_codon:yes gene_type:complete
MVTLRQIRSVVAVAEEGSFTKAAVRENATQSGISQHIAAVEHLLGVALFERTSDGVQMTPAGRRYYRHAITVLRNLETAAGEARAAGTGISGDVRAGLMPAFTRAALVPPLQRVITDHPQINIHIIEGYSGTLTEMVRAGQLDFALVPAFSGGVGLTVSPLARDREMLVSGPQMGLQHGQPVRLADLPPLKIIVPSVSNVRRGKLEEYFESHGGRIERLLEMDAMNGTLGLIARTDWVAVLPGLICVPDQDGDLRRISPIIDPPLYSDFVVIEPARKPISQQGLVFLQELREEINRLVVS